MRRIISILTLILILILRQAPLAVKHDCQKGSYSILQRPGFIKVSQGLGWTEDLNQSDPKDIPQVFLAFRNEQQVSVVEANLKLSRLLFHYHSNPLLTDRPPPGLRA